MDINKQIILGALILLLGGYSHKGEAADSSSEMTNQQNVFKNMMMDKGLNQAFEHKDWDVRNPFDTSSLTELKEVKETRNTPFVLQGIFLGTSKPSAIINGAVFGAGSKMEEYTVREIKEDSVVLLDADGNKIVLSLKK